MQFVYIYPAFYYLDPKFIMGEFLTAVYTIQYKFYEIKSVSSVAILFYKLKFI